ncbi:o-succinylbenzoate--CoA ligase [Pseudogracilibacillus sp. SE30717A]|uniref:o-succinylbenzoate--CoA ligase n=1 Tax=Pseudogracilibacillus sp. SE30717A TaxID=3098293 RepID=UPI00300E3BEF
MSEHMPHWLTKQASLSPNKVAIETADKQITFLELKETSERFARKLSSLGVKRGDPVAILSTNHVNMAITVHALSYLKAVAVMLNTRLTTDELTYQLSSSEAKLIITTEMLRDEKKLSHPYQKTFQEIFLLQEKDTELATHIDLHDPFTMMFTSGTTGFPKAVVHTYNNHWWSAISSVLNLGLTREDKWLLTLPIFHVGGLSILLRSVIYGMTVYLMEKYNKKVLLYVLNEKKITIASLVTLMLRNLLDDIDETGFPSHIRCILLGGGSVPESLLKLVKQNGIPLFQSYGMTETSSQIVTLNMDDALSKLGSAGKPLFPAEVTIDCPDEAGIGEIWVRGPMVMNGYKNEEANKKSFVNGWFKTGDLGHIDNEGFLFIVDRRSDLIISGGENIYPTEIENVLLELDEINEAAVVGKSDFFWGEVPVAFVVSKEKVAAESIQHYLAKRLATYKIPKEIYFIASLPRNASNKVLRHQLKSRVNL